MTAFEAAKPSIFYRPYVLAIALIFILVSVHIFINGVLPIVQDKKAETREKSLVILPLFFSIIPFVVSAYVCVIFFQTNTNYIKIYEAYRNGESEIVEGQITSFHPMPEALHDTEHFEVGGILFSYTADNSKTFYSRCKKDGGIFTGNGQTVRIWYVNDDGYNYIMKVELLDP